MRTTIILSPHQDDELIRFSSYIPFAADRGDQLILIEATDGAATSVGPGLGLDACTMTRWRNREQRSAWDWLTDGKGEPPVYAGLPDGAASHDRLVTFVEQVARRAKGVVELYVASWHYDRPGAVPADQHPDHRACVDVGRTMGAKGVIVRYGKHYTSQISGGARYNPTETQLLRMEAAAAAYKVVGQRSTDSILGCLEQGSRATW